MVISRVIIRVTPFRALITLLITYLLSPLPLKVDFKVSSFEVQGLRLLGFGVAWCSEPPSERKYPFPKRKNRRSPRSPSKLPTVNPSTPHSLNPKPKQPPPPPRPQKPKKKMLSGCCPKAGASPKVPHPGQRAKEIVDVKLMASRFWLWISGFGFISGFTSQKCEFTEYLEAHGT